MKKKKWRSALLELSLLYLWLQLLLLCLYRYEMSENICILSVVVNLRLAVRTITTSNQIFSFLLQFFQNISHFPPIFYNAAMGKPEVVSEDHHLIRPKHPHLFSTFLIEEKKKYFHQISIYVITFYNLAMGKPEACSEDHHHV